VSRCPAGQCESTESLYERTGHPDASRLPFVPENLCHYCRLPVCLDDQRTPVSEVNEICGVCPDGMDAA